MIADELFKYDSPFVIESLQEVSTQLVSLRSIYGFGHEAESVDSVEWNYFIELQKIFSQNKLQPYKFRSLKADLPNRAVVNHQIIRLKDRPCLWDGNRLYLLSRLHVIQGASSLFRRAVMIPWSGNEDLQFYAMLVPVKRQFDDPADAQRYIDSIAVDYVTSERACHYLYEYVETNVIRYESYQVRNTDMAYKRKLPTLLTRSYGEWRTLLDILRGSDGLNEVSFLSVLGWFISVISLHDLSCLHRDLADKNCLVFGPGVFVQLIDLCSAVYCEKDLVVQDSLSFSSHPDFNCRFGFHDQQADEFSVALNLLQFNVFDHNAWDMKELIDLIDHANYEYTDDSTLQLKIQRYKKIYSQIEASTHKPSWSILLPHLLRLAHPDRSSRGSLIGVFYDQKILNKIRDCINAIVTDSKFSKDFITINGWSLVNVITDLYRHHDQTCITSTALMMLLVFALHYAKVPVEARMNHKLHIDSLLESLTISPRICPIIFHYEAEFPGLISKRLSASFIDTMIIEVFNEFLYELDQVSAVVVDLCSQVNDRLVLASCNDSINDLIDQVTLRGECESVIDAAISEIEVKHKYSKRIVNEVLDHVLDQTVRSITSRAANRHVVILQKNLLILLSAYITLYNVLDSTNHLTAQLDDLLRLSLTLTSAVVISSYLVSKYATENSMTDSQLKVGLFRIEERQPYDTVKGLLAPKV